MQRSIGPPEKSKSRSDWSAESHKRKRSRKEAAIENGLADYRQNKSRRQFNVPRSMELMESKARFSEEDSPEAEDTEPIADSNSSEPKVARCSISQSWACLQEAHPSDMSSLSYLTLQWPFASLSAAPHYKFRRFLFVQLTWAYHILARSYFLYPNSTASQIDVCSFHFMPPSGLKIMQTFKWETLTWKALFHAHAQSAPPICVCAGLARTSCLECVPRVWKRMPLLCLCCS